MYEDRNRMSGFHSGTLISVAVFFEVVQVILSLIPFIGGLIASLITLFAFLVFWVWFHVLGIGFFDTTLRLVVRMTMLFTEIIPYVNMLPILTIGTILVIWQVRHEDKKYNKERRESYEASQVNASRYPNGSLRPQKPNEHLVKE